MDDLTQLLNRAGDGGKIPAEQLLPLVYQKLRYFVGLTIPEAAEVLGISTATAERHWAMARVWLFREISRRRDGQGGS